MVNIRLCNVLTLCFCALFLVQGGKWTCLPARETTHTQIHDMLPQQYYNEIFIFLTCDFS